VVEILIKAFVFGVDVEEKLEFFSQFSGLKNKLKKESPKEVYRKAKENFDYLCQSNEISFNNLGEIEKMNIERDLYGTNLIFSCFDIKDRRIKIENLIKENRIGGLKENKDYTLVQFKNISMIKDKNSKDMAFLDLEDINGETMPGIIFSSSFIKSDIIENEVYCVRGQKEDKFILEAYKNLDSLFNKK